LIFLSKWSRKKIKPIHRNENLYVLANGPSLNADMEEIGADFFVGKQNLVVNYFAFSPVYEKIKPTHYVISAVELFQDEPSITLKDSNDRLYLELEKKTDWEIILYAPMPAKNYKNWKKILSNSNIKVHYYNITVAEGSQWFVNWVLKHQFGMTRLQNVLVAALTLSILSGYKNVYLLGVDHSWLKEISVTSENDVLINQPHFYEKNTKALKMIKNNTETRKLHEILYKFYYSFKSYFVLKNFADKNGVQIYNLTSGSYIDAFERKPISELKN
jgi:hypothetical protein